MGKKDKEHKKRVAKRNEAIKLQQKKFEKVREEFINQLIEKEKQAGKFDSVPGDFDFNPMMDLGLGPQI